MHDHFSEHPNTYYKDINGKLQSFVGTWIYDDGTDYFRINIGKRKELANSKYNVHYDRLSIKYEYRKNGITKYYNISSFNVPTGANTKPSELESNFVKNDVVSVVYYEPSFTDCHRRRIGSLILQLVSGSSTQLQWTRTTDEHYFNDDPCENGTPTDNSDFLIPATMVLTKI